MEEAVEAGNVEEVKRLLVDEPGSFYFALLPVVYRHQHRDLFEYLIDYFAKTEHATWILDYLLSEACRCNCLWAAKRLLVVGAGCESQCVKFACASTDDTLYRLIMDKFEWTFALDDTVWDAAFVGACESGIMSRIEYLYDGKVLRDFNDPFEAACAGDHLGVAKWLRDNGSVDNLKEGFKSACFNGHLEVVQWCVQLGVNSWDDGLNMAWLGNHPRVVKWLIEMRPHNMTESDYMDVQFLIEVLNVGLKEEKLVHIAEVQKHIAHRKLKNVVVLRVIDCFLPAPLIKAVVWPMVRYECVGS